MVGTETIATIGFAHSQDEFKELVQRLESGARTLDRLAQRMFIVFKDDDTIETIGRGRYADQSTELKAYVDEQRERRAAFSAAMNDGSLVCREVYSASELRAYAEKPLHGDVQISKDQARRMFAKWRDALRDYPNNYQARISEDLLPLKYAISDGRTVMMHQGVELRTKGRLKGFLLACGGVADPFVADFKIAWSDAEKHHGDNAAVIRWIDENLLGDT
jgi:hypothetical protein